MRVSHTGCHLVVFGVQVTEHYQTSVATQLRAKIATAPKDIFRIAHEVLTALVFLNGMGIVSRNLTADNVRLTEDGSAKVRAPNGSTEWQHNVLGPARAHCARLMQSMPRAQMMRLADLARQN